ncbi:hypothetical protein HK099_007333 [Clydaea vesicula]|uniref:Uncharacterized protein n=1 Tax=Clydaea vesicula TaxID=447962 RepID=A0AAD5XXY2_9FUNG|nr:hypothetical protein HK099_007333 [Clydaea vesicula]
MKKSNLDNVNEEESENLSLSSLIFVSRLEFLAVEKKEAQSQFFLGSFLYYGKLHVNVDHITLDYFPNFLPYPSQNLIKYLPNKQLALKYFKLAADQHHLEAVKNLAFILLNDEEVRDRQLAFKILSKETLARNDDIKALKIVSKIFREKIQLKKNEKFYVKLKTHGQDLVEEKEDEEDDDLDTLNIEFEADNNLIEKALLYTTKSATLGNDLDSLLVLADYYAGLFESWNKVWGYEIDLNKSVNFYVKAVDLGSEIALKGISSLILDIWSSGNDSVLNSLEISESIFRKVLKFLQNWNNNFNSGKDYSFDFIFDINDKKSTLDAIFNLSKKDSSFALKRVPVSKNLKFQPDLKKVKCQGATATTKVKKFAVPKQVSLPLLNSDLASKPSTIVNNDELTEKVEPTIKKLVKHTNLLAFSDGREYQSPNVEKLLKMDEIITEVSSISQSTLQKAKESDISNEKSIELHVFAEKPNFKLLSADSATYSNNHTKISEVLGPSDEVKNSFNSNLLILPGSKFKSVEILEHNISKEDSNSSISYTNYPNEPCNEIPGDEKSSLETTINFINRQQSFLQVVNENNFDSVDINRQSNVQKHFQTFSTLNLEENCNINVNCNDNEKVPNEAYLDEGDFQTS